MEKIKELIKRYAGWAALIAGSIMLLAPRSGEMRAFYLAALAECAAIALSGIAAFAFTRIDFTGEERTYNLGLIFLGVHICTGLTMAGVYMAQL